MAYRNITFDLTTPIQHNGASISRLDLREATAGDIAAADDVKGETGKMLAILAAMSGQPAAVLRAITVTDLKRLSQVAGPLMGNDETSEADGPT